MRINTARITTCALRGDEFTNGLYVHHDQLAAISISSLIGAEVENASESPSTQPFCRQGCGVIMSDLNVTPLSLRQSMRRSKTSTSKAIVPPDS